VDTALPQIVDDSIMMMPCPNGSIRRGIELFTADPLNLGPIWRVVVDNLGAATHLLFSRTVLVLVRHKFLVVGSRASYPFMSAAISTLSGPKIKWVIVIVDMQCGQGGA
jgi:hypothetical protein